MLNRHSTPEIRPAIFAAAPAIHVNLPPVPRALLRANNVHGAGGERVGAAAMLDELTTAFAEFKAKHEGENARIVAAMGDFQKEYEALVVRNAVLSTPPGNGPGSRPEDQEYTTAFQAMIRTGELGATQDVAAANRMGERGAINAAMQTGSDGSGGYLAPVEWDRTIAKAQAALSPMRQVCSVITTTVRGFTKLWQNERVGSGWVGETASRPATSTLTFTPLNFSVGEVYAFPLITQGLLDDSALNLEVYLGTEIATEFARQEGIAFVSGDGVNKPTGLLTYVTGNANAAAHPGGAIPTVNSGSAAAVTGDGLVDTFYAVPSPYRQNAAWMMSSATGGLVSKLKDGQGNYLWRDAFIAGQPATILGKPVVFNEDLPSVSAGSTPILFGDFQAGYLINDRIGVRVLRDPYTNKPFVGFYTTKRVGGGLLDPNAIRAMKVSA